MMKDLQGRRWSSIAFLFGVIAASLAMCAEELVSLDLMFPQNWYTQLLHNCMGVWGELDELIAQDDAMPFHEQIKHIDAIVGKIIYCVHCVKNCTKEDIARVSGEDFGYILRIVYSLDKKCEKLTGKHFDQRMICLQKVIKKLRDQLHFLLKSYQASFSPGAQ